MSHHASSSKPDVSFVSWTEFFKQNSLPSLALVCLAVWLHAADNLIVATMLPSMVAEIGGAPFISWTVSLYEIGSIIAGASSAVLSLRFGLRHPMAGAAFVFGIGCLLSALAPTMGLVLIGRLLQGFSGGGLVAFSFIAVNVLFPKRYMARAMAAVSLIWGGSAFLGPLIGGFFVEYATWRWGFCFFAMQSLLLGCWILFFARFTEGPKPTHITSIPMLRLGLLCVGILSICFAGINIHILRTCLLLGLGLSCLIGFLWQDSKANDNRLLPHSPMNITTPVGAILVLQLTLAIGTIALTAYGPILMLILHGASPITAGYILACVALGWSTMAVVVSGTPEKYDGFLIILGSLAVVISIIGLIYAVPNGPLWLIALCTALEGAGFGTSRVFLLRRATATATPQEAKRISAAIPTLSRSGYALGAAYVGIVANFAGFSEHLSPAKATDIAGTIFLSGLPFGAISLIALFYMSRGRKISPASVG